MLLCEIGTSQERTSAACHSGTCYTSVCCICMLDVCELYHVDVWDVHWDPFESGFVSFLLL